MKTNIFRLNSVVPHGVGGPESGAINLIYTTLLQELEQDVYGYIGVNQIGNDLDEFVMKQGKIVHVNIRYPAYDDFESKTISEKNRIRLDVVHTALLRVAVQDKKLDIGKLEEIKSKILSNDFSFDFVCKSYLYNKRSSLIAKIIVHPQMEKFDYYVSIEDNLTVKCRKKIYSGLTNVVYYPELFSQGKWKGENEFIITGKRKEVEIKICVDECKIEFKNLTGYPKPPYFEMMRADISAEEKDKAYQDWQHSLPPAAAAIIRQADN
jgi:hypothetical protein